MLRLFSQLFSRAKPETDLSFGLLTQLAIEPLLVGNQWEKLEAIAMGLAPDDLTRLLDGLCLSHRHTQAIQRYLAAGHSELRWLVTGVYNTFQAWESRGGMVADETSQKQITGFFYYLSQAHEQLSQPFENPALQAEAAARLVRVGMGLNEPDLAKEAFDLCTELAPTHLMGHFNYLRVASPWWHGSVADLTTFVDSITDPSLHTLFQLIYLNEVHSFLAHEQNSVATATKLLNQDYRPRLDAVLAGPPQSQAQETCLTAVYHNNYLAGLHHILGNPAARNQLIRALGANMTPQPWNYFGLTTAAAVQNLART